MLDFFVIIFGLFAASRVILRYKDKEISFTAMIFWILIWTAILTIVIFPSLSISFAKLIGIGRGVDSAFFIAILLLFYLIFRLYVKIDNIDKNLTDLSINVSKNIHHKNSKP